MMRENTGYMCRSEHLASILRLYFNNDNKLMKITTETIRRQELKGYVQKVLQVGETM